ncbi:superoxide dismutase family protein [Erythrobacter donghaensis]|uniref:superoxide dismutase family protein n=1 Tax=Erythrobacter donghaensis TaxID=267135 RepID=UPI000A375505|nr:superoxide dismutase family protein [Erythrobacter donghaensis]
MSQSHPFSPRLDLAGLAALAGVPLAATAHEAEMADTASVVANVKTADGTDAGTVIFTPAANGVIVTASLKNLTEGMHGFHIHETGACTPDFTAAGSHFNPQGKEHGFDTEGGYHTGDLPNISIGADGTGEASFTVPGVTLAGKTTDQNPYLLGDADGSAVMIHAEADDYRAMASSGARVACGVIMPKGG